MSHYIYQVITAISKAVNSYICSSEMLLQWQKASLMFRRKQAWEVLWRHSSSITTINCLSIVAFKTTSISHCVYKWFIKPHILYNGICSLQMSELCLGFMFCFFLITAICWVASKAYNITWFWFSLLFSDFSPCSNPINNMKIKALSFGSSILCNRVAVVNGQQYERKKP